MKINKFAQMAVKHVMLERIQLALQYDVSRHVIDNLDLDMRIAMLSDIGDKMALTLRAEIYGERMKDVALQEPATWWEMLKRDHFPAWALSRWPVKYAKIPIKAWWVYPMFNRVPKAPGLEDEFAVPVLDTRNFMTENQRKAYRKESEAI